MTGLTLDGRIVEHINHRVCSGLIMLWRVMMRRLSRRDHFSLDSIAVLLWRSRGHLSCMCRKDKDATLQPTPLLGQK